MEINENYEEVKQSAKTVLQILTSNNFYYCIFLIVLLIVLVKLIDLVFYPLNRRKNVLIPFTKACLKVFVVITIGMRICSLIPVVSDFTSQILMSSSLIIVVLGFVFQEGLSNVVHGFILSVFKPFRNGDRVRITVDGQSITGFIVSMDARHTVIRNIINSSHVIIPNSKMDMCIIENNYFDGDRTTSSFMDLSITYESNIDKAMAMLSQAVMEHPFVEKLRTQENITEPVKVMVRELGESAVALRATVVTKTVDENFMACSDIRYRLVKELANEPDVSFAYPHLMMVENNHLFSGESKVAN